jgi:hypothetical protein
MLARDFMFLNPQAQAHSKLGQAQPQTQAVQQLQNVHQHSYNAPAPSYQMLTQQTQNYTYSPATSNNMYSMPPPPSSPCRSSDGTTVNIEHNSNPINVQMMHPQQRHTSIQQQQDQLSQAQLTYSHDCTQLQQQLYNHADNSVNSMLSDLLSIPQDTLSSTTSTAAANCAAAGEEEQLTRTDVVFRG